MFLDRNKSCARAPCTGISTYSPPLHCVDVLANVSHRIVHAVAELCLPPILSMCVAEACSSCAVVVAFTGVRGCSSCSCVGFLICGSSRRTTEPEWPVSLHLGILSVRAYGENEKKCAYRFLGDIACMCCPVDCVGQACREIGLVLSLSTPFRLDVVELVIRVQDWGECISSCA